MDELNKMLSKMSWEQYRRLNYLAYHLRWRTKFPWEISATGIPLHILK